MKVVDKNRENSTVRSWNLPIGTVFRGRIGTNCRSKVYLRALESVVDLEDPDRTWVFSNHGASPEVHDYQPLEATLHVEAR